MKWLIDQFHIGLSEQLKDELTRVRVPDTLEALMHLVTHLDRHFRDRQQERKLMPVPSVRRPETLPSPVPVSISTFGAESQEEPKQIGVVRGPLSVIEKNRRRTLQLCLYCAKPGHFLKDCPIKPWSPIL